MEPRAVLNCEACAGAKPSTGTRSEISVVDCGNRGGDGPGLRGLDLYHVPVHASLHGGRHFYVRQLRDMKLKFRIEEFKPAKMVIFADWCGGTLARAHARSGEPASISGYLGKADTFDQAIASFAVAYADQVERDFEGFANAVRQGKLAARMDDGD
jgi:hypothetical protein